jgi:hypothetical protein
LSVFFLLRNHVPDVNVSTGEPGAASSSGVTSPADAVESHNSMETHAVKTDVMEGVEEESTSPQVGGFFEKKQFDGLVMFCVWNLIIQIQIRSDPELFALADQEPKK